MPLIATDRIDRMPAPKRRQHGLTLVELTVTLLILTVLATIAIRSTNDLGFQVRYEQTKERLEMIRHAILGNPRLIINGQQAISGFVADMGRLPVNIRELIVLDSYCTDNTYTEKNICETNNEIWLGRKSYGFCSDPTYFLNETLCTTNGGDWFHQFNGGWNGPYLNISGNPDDPDAFTDGWGREAEDEADQNYGWQYNLDDPRANDLSITSLGKNQAVGGDDYDADYPENQPVIRSTDWLVAIPQRVNVSLVAGFTDNDTKPLPPISMCTNPEYSTKTSCDNDVDETWYGGCSKAGYFNKDSCPSGGEWYSCSDGTNKDKADCINADPDNNWYYGQGYGCSDQSKTTKADCESPEVWRSCTDGTSEDKITCENNNEIWYGDSIFEIPLVGPHTAYLDKSICMTISFRRNGQIKSLESGSKEIREDGSHQIVRFDFNVNDQTDCEGNGGIWDVDQCKIPFGQIAIGIYKYNDKCDDPSNETYPANREPITIDLHPGAHLPTITW